MERQRVTIKIIPDTRRVKIDGKYPLKLRITYKGIRKYYNTIYDLTIMDWDLMNSNNAKGSLRAIRNDLAKLENEAGLLIQNMGDFSFAKFEKKFFTNVSNIGFLKETFENYINQFVTALKMIIYYHSFTH
jgi:hypothetical protein